MDKEIEELIASMTKDGKPAADIAKAVSEKFKKSEAPPPNPNPPPAPSPDPSLRDKVINDNKDKGDKAAEAKKLEGALRFVMGGDKFITDHKSLLPKEISDIFARADKETYESSIDKANAIRSAIVESFFSLQANLDLLTQNQKDQVEDFLKLSRKAKEERSEQVYLNVFEPALEMLKRIKKAEQVGKSNQGSKDETDSDKAYREKLMSGSKKHYLGKDKS